MSTMIPYVVRPGDYLTRIAARRGFDARAVWQHERNAELRRRRPNPEVLAAGDILYVPESRPSRSSLTVGGTNAFSVRLPTVKIELALTGSDGRPLANKRYWVDGEEAGTTDGDGKVALAVRPTQPSVSLRVEDSPDTYLLRLAHLDPVDTGAGVRQRLVNLHYLPEDGGLVTEEHLAEALRNFQRRMGLDESGAPDDATRERLVSEHGS
ncbi:MAG: peptidoglycan-binding protein [Myxococcales bacterium]|nr:peptidoglycan-binding protein [Myxococcales bacterium]